MTDFPMLLRIRYNHPLTKRLLVFLMAMIAANLAFAGKPGRGEAPPPSPPPVNYQLSWIDNIWGNDWHMRANDMNDTGTVVGNAWSADQHTGFAYMAGVTLDLNYLGATWVDLDSPLEPAVGWTATRAYKINQLGQIVGTAQKDGTERAFVLDFPQDSPPIFTLLASLGLPQALGVAINDIGVVVATSAAGYIVYVPGIEPQVLYDVAPTFDRRADINNFGELVTGQGVYVSPGVDFDYSAGVLTQEADHWFYGVNDSGQICGSRETAKGKNGQQGGPIRRGAFPDGIEQLLSPGHITDFAGGINLNGDTCFTDGGRGHIYTELLGSNGQQLGVLALDDLIIFEDAAAETEWRAAPCTPWAINNRNVTGFGQVCGISGTSPLRAFVLTPIALPSP